MFLDWKTQYCLNSILKAFKASPIKIPMTFFTELEQKNFKFVRFLGSNRCNGFKPCSYYQLHRNGPIDLEKYKPDQGTIRK